MAPILYRLIKPSLIGTLVGIVASLVFANELLDKPLEIIRTRYSEKSYVTFVALRKLMVELEFATEQTKVSAINQFVNEKILFVNDIDLWQTRDYWATPVETFGRLAGDCEDFSIAKYAWLKVLGIPPEKLRLTYVRANMMNGLILPHMVLTYYRTPSAEPLVLDNLNHQLLPASQRNDLTPVFSFNDQGLFSANKPQYKIGSATSISKWSEVLTRMREDSLK